MKYLIFQLFSGVGFCNQLFSLETAIYLANISNRKLILLIKYPLCHCGRSSWDYGTFMEFFSNSYKKYLPNGIEICYGNDHQQCVDVINDTTKTDRLVFGTNFSQIGFIDKGIFLLHNSDLNNIHFKQFLNFRKPVILDISSWLHEYVYITESNASRCFSNFLTSAINYQLMSNICESLTHLNEAFYDIYKDLNLPSKYISIHFRFGDVRWSKSEVDSMCIQNNTHLLNTIESYKEYNNNIVIMSDRHDTLYLENITKVYTDNITYTDTIVQDIELTKYFPNISKKVVVSFLIQKYICERANVFIGYEGSTVSHHIQYLNHIHNKPHIHYTSKDIKNVVNEYSWFTNGMVGANIGWKLFFPDNIYINKLKIITLTNDGYKELTENLLISMKKLGIESLLKIYCIGHESYNYFKNKYYFNEVEQVDTNETYLNNWIPYKALQNTDAEGKLQWATITSYKIYAINKELVVGNDIIFIDGDIVFEKDPFQYMLDCLEPNTELLIQNDEQTVVKPAMCTGFFWMKSNENTIRITDFDTITKNIDSFQNDQQYIRRFSKQINHKYLDVGLFPNGKYYRDNHTNIEPYIIHFNYDVSEFKIKRMKQFNKWYLDDEHEYVYQPPRLISSINNVVKKSNIHANFTYKPNDSNSICNYLEKHNIQIKQGYITQVDEHANQLLTHLKSICDVNSIKNVMEIGFLAGHSAELFLKLNDQIHVTSIDEHALKSVFVGKEYIDMVYPNRHTLLKGNSTDILNSTLIDTNRTFDIILIDGSYKYDITKQDILLARKYSSLDTVVIINNVLENTNFIKYWNTDPTLVAKEMIDNKTIIKIKQIDIDVGRGTLLCKYSN